VLKKSNKLSISSDPPVPSYTNPLSA
jgi:hypothetical protein